MVRTDHFFSLKIIFSFISETDDLKIFTARFGHFSRFSKNVDRCEGMFDSHVEYLGCRCFPVEGLPQRALAIQNGIKVQLEPRNDITSTTGTSNLFKILFLTLSSKLRNLIALLLLGFPSGVVLFLKIFLLVYKSFNAMIPLYL